MFYFFLSCDGFVGLVIGDPGYVRVHEFHFTSKTKIVDKARLFDLSAFHLNIEYICH